MNFEFSDEQKEFKAQARRFLEARSPTAAARAVLEGSQPYDRALWRGCMAKSQTSRRCNS